MAHERRTHSWLESRRTNPAARSRNFITISTLGRRFAITVRRPSVSPPYNEPVCESATPVQADLHASIRVFPWDETLSSAKNRGLARKPTSPDVPRPPAPFRDLDHDFICFEPNSKTGPLMLNVALRSLVQTPDGYAAKNVLPHVVATPSQSIRSERHRRRKLQFLKKGGHPLSSLHPPISDQPTLPHGLAACQVNKILVGICRSVLMNDSESVKVHIPLIVGVNNANLTARTS